MLPILKKTCLSCCALLATANQLCANQVPFLLDDSNSHISFVQLRADGVPRELSQKAASAPLAMNRGLLNETLTEGEKIIANCNEAMQSLDVSMACIARAVYNFPIVGNTVADWDLVMAYEESSTIAGLPGLGTDKMKIYRNSYGTCALAISGSDDASDWVTDFTFMSKSACNLDMHAGFYDEITRLTSENPRWPEMKAYLQTSCSQTLLTGHSLGGALVSALAACAAAGTESALEGLPFDGVYTFGAPAISKTPATNKGGCFAGKRMFNLGPIGGDPVPAACDLVGLKHPKMEAVRLWSGFFGDAVQEVHSCEDEATYSEPRFGIIPLALQHLMTFYIDRSKGLAR